MKSLSRETQLKLNELSEKVIGLSFKVHNRLGRGFVEKVYENALTHELAKESLHVKQQMPIIVRYDSIIIGEFFADIVIENVIVLEIKAVSEISKVHEAQCFNYLRASDLRLGLVLNFGASSVQVRRIVNQF